MHTALRDIQNGFLNERSAATGAMDREGKIRDEHPLGQYDSSMFFIGYTTS